MEDMMNRLFLHIDANDNRTIQSPKNKILKKVYFYKRTQIRPTLVAKHYVQKTKEVQIIFDISNLEFVKTYSFLQK